MYFSDLFQRRYNKNRMSESLDTRLLERLFPASFQSSNGRHARASPLLPFPLRPHMTAGGGGAAAGAPPPGNKVREAARKSFFGGPRGVGVKDLATKKNLFWSS